MNILTVAYDKGDGRDESALVVGRTDRNGNQHILNIILGDDADKMLEALVGKSDTDCQKT